MNHAANQTANHAANAKAIRIWLFVCAGAVLAMMIIGAITRLTESGLSMVEWRPLIGALPPMSDAEWQRVFALYTETPEYQKKNSWMEIEDFKTIFFWEWFHRFWGRLIGLIFALPLAFFWIRKRIPNGYHLKLLGLLALGSAQGLMGWYMVKSGLVDQPAVSHYRLAAHLSLAILIFACLVLTALPLTKIKNRQNRPLYIHGIIALMFITLTIIWGAFTAGLDAGLVYNETFPKMGGAWLPPDFWKYDTLRMNILENHSAVQFTHRWLAITSIMAVLSLWAHGLIRNNAFPMLHAAAAMSVIQVGLGIATLLSGIHLHIAVTHQAGAMLLFALLLICIYQTRRIK